MALEPPPLLARRSCCPRREKRLGGGRLVAAHCAASRTVATASVHVAERLPRLCPRSHSSLQESPPSAPTSKRASVRTR